MKYTNPVIPGFYPDPSICRLDQDYFLVTSSFEYFPGVPLFHSRDLVNWEQIGHCLTRPSQLPLQGAHCSGGIFAPTIRQYNGRFYMVTTNTSHGGNFFVWTDDPYAEWSEPVWLDQGGIDPSLFFDTDGKVYLTTSQNQQSIIDIASGRRLGDIRKTWPGTGGGYLEAPHLYHIGDWYYLLVAEGGTGRGHMATIARGRSPWGPFEACPHNPILSNRGCTGNSVQATGHGDLIQAHDGRWWLVFLAIREYPGRFPRFHNLGRETFLAPVTWTDEGWPVVNGNGTVSVEMDTPLLPAAPRIPSPVRDDFDAPTLAPYWNFLRNPDEQNYSLTERLGWLTLYPGRASLDDDKSPTFLGRRQQHSTCQFRAAVDFGPGDREESGISVLMNARHHYEIGLRLAGSRRQVFVRRRIGDLVAEVATAELPEGVVIMTVRAAPDRYQFFFSTPAIEETKLAEGETRYLSTEVAGGFTGVYIGLYATANGTANPAPASVDWVDYESKST